MDDASPTLSLPTDYLAKFIAATRGMQVKEGEVDPGSGSNPVDDKMWDVLQDDPQDLTREEIREQLQGLTERQQAELVALMWIGRGDAEPEEWEDTVGLALTQGWTYTSISAQAPTRCGTLGGRRHALRHCSSG